MPDDLQDQLVRDLLWLVNSPSYCVGPETPEPTRLKSDQIDPDALTSFMATRSEHRVGRHFEHLLHFWLAEVRQVQMVGHGMQLRDGNRTIGELDFLYRDEHEVFVHCEASVKFFLHHPRPNTSHFPGPNATDNFEAKMAKLFKRQLPRSRTHVPDVEQREAFVKGITFYHPAVAPPSHLPARMPDDHQRGIWLRHSEFNQLLPREIVSGHIAPKPHWLASAGVDRAVDLATLGARVNDHFARLGHPIMVCLFSAEGAEHRLFVVPGHWPERRSPSLGEEREP